MDSSYSSNYIRVKKINNKGYAIFISPNVPKDKLRSDLDNIIINEISKKKNFNININISVRRKNINTVETTKLLEIQEKNLGKRGKGRLFVIDYSLRPYQVEIYTHNNYEELKEYLKEAIDKAIECIEKYSAYLN